MYKIKQFLQFIFLNLNPMLCLKLFKEKNIQILLIDTGPNNNYSDLQYLNISNKTVAILIISVSMPCRETENQASLAIPTI